MLLFLFFLNGIIVHGQELGVAPQFENCESLSPKMIKICFDEQLQRFVFDNFKMPDVVLQNNYKGIVNVLFEVDTLGVFKVQYVDAIYPELTTESKRVFSMLPKIKPALQNGKPAFAKFNLKIAIPLKNPTAEIPSEYESKVDSIKANR